MAERHRSNDGTRETEKFLSEEESASQQGRSGGALQRDVATQAEKERAVDDPDGHTRVTGEDKRNHGEEE